MRPLIEILKERPILDAARRTLFLLRQMPRWGLGSKIDQVILETP